MARTIRIEDIGDYAENQFNKLITAAVLETDGRLKLRSPVDTGRFRASWAIGQNAAPSEGKDPGEYRQSLPPTAVNYQLGNEKVGNVYSVHNNLIYAERLAINGSRKSGVPGGWVDSIAKDIQTYVNAEADRIGRSS
ncbi:MAG: HK97 gp10 family phage protein [Marivivens sp.]|jgi:hypothetical protein|nr:HK97 gp10 family phage protein [Marivivens sp.]